jgi:seryl-tRNA synthetase
MIDVKFLRENKQAVKEAVLNKGIKNFDFDLLISLDEERLELLKKVEELRAKRNQISSEIPNVEKDKKEELLLEAGKLKNNLKEIEDEFSEVDKNFMNLFYQLPNIPSPKMPIGKGE